MSRRGPAGVIPAAVVLFGVSLAGVWPPATCARMIAAGNWARAILRCRAEHAGSGSLSALAKLGYAHLRLEQPAAAQQVAAELLATTRAADGELLMCQAIKAEQDDPGLAVHAREHGERAYALHQEEENEAVMLRDALCVSQSAWMAGELSIAEEAAAKGIRLARRVGAQEVQALIARADALRLMGDYATARSELELALARSRSRNDLSWVHLKLGMVYAESEELALANQEFGAAERADPDGEGVIARSLALNRASLLACEDQDEADAMLDKYETYSAATPRSFESLFLRAVIAGNRGERAAALRYLGQAEALEPPDADWRWELETVRAELAASIGDAAGDLEAERAYRSAIDMVAKLRANSRERSAFLVSTHRDPYDGLIALLARQQRWHEVVALVLQLDASDMLRATARPMDAPRTATPSLDLAKPLPPVPSVDEVVAAWRERDLVILVAPIGRRVCRAAQPVVRVRIVDGTVTGERLGSAAKTLSAAARLFANPDDALTASALGSVFVPDDDGTRTETLDVLAVGPLGKVPLAALRERSGALVIGRRPLARSFSISPPASVHPPGAGRAVVVADPRGDLPVAREEGRMVAAQVAGDVALFGAGAAPATRARFWEARDASLLHVAAHVADHGRSRALRLEDGDVTTEDILGRGIAPRLAVLASCGSGAAHDEEGWGSIAAALLEAGTEAVVATDRTIADDRATLELVTAFYAQRDWRADPARALARAQWQQAQRGVPAAQWASFGVLRGPPSVIRPASSPALSTVYPARVQESSIDGRRSRSLH